MISTDYPLEKHLAQSKALQLILRKTLNGEMAAFTYNPATGIAVVQTRNFPPFNESEISESDLSREVASLADDYKIAMNKLNDRKRILDRQESDLNLQEIALADDRKLFAKDRKRLDAQIAKFHKDLADASRAGLMARVKSFFHNIT